MEGLSGLKAYVSGTNVIIILGVWLGYRVLVALYNISPLHPLFKFPGPKLAALSYLYEAYYDFILVGRYSREIERMHERYGETTLD